MDSLRFRQRSLAFSCTSQLHRRRPFPAFALAAGRFAALVVFRADRLAAAGFFLDFFSKEGGFWSVPFNPPAAGRFAALVVFRADRLAAAGFFLDFFPKAAGFGSLPFNPPAAGFFAAPLPGFLAFFFAGGFGAGT